MMPNEKNTKRVILALDQAYEKFIQLEDKSIDEAEIVSYRCLYTNIYESKLYVEQMQKEIDRLKAEQPKDVRCKDCISRVPAKDPDCCVCRNPVSPCYQREVRDSDLCQFAEGR